MEVEVKCPKCRYRFLAQAVAGETALACVCERCGTPFTFQLSAPAVPPPIPPSAKASAPEDAQRTIPDAAPKVTPPPYTPTPPPIPHEHGGTIAAVATRQQDRKDFEAAALHPDRKVGGCAKGCIIVFVVVLLLVGVGMYRLIHFFSSDSQYEESPTVTAVAATHTSPTTADEEEGEKDDFVEMREEPPSWLQGMWHGKAPYGDISMSIDVENKMLSITVGSRQPKSGSFYYEQGKLHCEYKDGSQKTYIVDNDKRCVVTGDGVELEP